MAPKEMEITFILSLIIYEEFYFSIYLGNTIRSQEASAIPIYLHSLRCHHSALSIGSARARQCMKWKCHVWYRWNASKQFVECGWFTGVHWWKKTSVPLLPFICQWQVIQEDNNHFLSEYLAQFADKLPSDGESEDQNTSMVINTMLVTSKYT